VTQSKAKLVPYAIAVGVIAFVGFLQSLRHWSTAGGVFEELEWKSYDWRARSAMKQQPPCATNLGFINIEDDSIKNLATAMSQTDAEGRPVLDYQFGLYWPRQVYGRLIRELKAQGARLITFDVLFNELRPDHAPVQAATNQPPVPSDDFFANELRQGGNVVIAATKELLPNRLFRSATKSIGDISTEKDSDGVLRRAQAFHVYRFWHPRIEALAEEFEFDLGKARIREGQKITLRRPRDGATVEIPLERNNVYDVAAFSAQFGRNNAPPGVQLRAIAFRDTRVWHMGILMAAASLGLDLDRAELHETKGAISVPGTNGVSRVIPVDKEGFFYVDWSVGEKDTRLTKEDLFGVLLNEFRRRTGRVAEIKEQWKDKVLIIGSTATGNDLTDRGSTPIRKDAYLVSKHWNVANSVIMDRFITRSPLWLELLAVVLMGVLAAGLTWKLHAPWGSLAVLVVIGIYLLAALYVFVEYRYWIPIVLPTAGAMVLNHFALLTYNIVFEQGQKRHVRAVFAKLVSPNVVNELLQRDEIRLDGKREKVTVFFSDVRGFTKLTDMNQARAEKYVQDHHLTGAAAEAHFDKSAKDTLDTVNLYLAAIADQIKKHDGTLDKYIGDCVMAFWGAPTPNEKHAVGCVRAAIDAQIAMHDINLKRAVENKRREAENAQRAAAGQEPLDLLALLDLGTGINTGTAIAGMMGSEAHIMGYTIFGREVNLASRLEGVSGHSRIIIGEATFRDLEKYDMELGALCVEQERVTPKGFSTPIRIWEVPWKKFLPPDPEGSPAAEASVPGKPAAVA